MYSLLKLSEGQYNSPQGKYNRGTLPYGVCLLAEVCYLNHTKLSFYTIKLGKVFHLFKKDDFQQGFREINLNLKTHSKKPCTANAVQGFSNYRFLYAERKPRLVGRFYSTAVKQKPSVTSLSSATCRITCRRTRGRS